MSIELLAPAGDLEKLKVALLYGADAVFVGGREFSLRARASNFEIADILEATNFAHDLGKKVYVTTNIIPHEEDLEGLIPYLKDLESVHVDAIITASPVIIEAAIKHTNLEVHLSTQQSAINSPTVNFWYDYGIKRVVLGRELDINQIDYLTKQTKADIEVFIHGGMCMSYSGRCSLSDNMTGRDANRGGCAHSCRWNYGLSVNGNIHNDISFSMSSKDLSAPRYVTHLIDSGVKSLKIEGRMKSVHYIATIVSVYRRIIDEYIQTGQIQDYQKYEDDIVKAENRLTSVGYLAGTPTHEQQLFNMRSEKPNQLFIGLVREYDLDTSIVTIEQRNYFARGQKIEIVAPSGQVSSHVVEDFYDENMQLIEIARHPKQMIKIKINQPLEVYSLVRLA